MTDKPPTGGPASPSEQRAHTLPGQRAVNLLVRGLLRTPGLAPIVGGRLVTLYVVGRKSGRHYCVPVAYMAEGNDLLIGTSSGWGRNLRTVPSVLEISPLAWLEQSNSLMAAAVSS